MDRATSRAPADRLFCAMELSKNSWLLGIQFPDRQKASVYPLKGGDSEGLMAKLVAACDRWRKVSGKEPSIILCYEAGYDAFWLARFLKARCAIVHACSTLASRIGAAGYKLMRTSHAPWTSQQDLPKATPRSE